MPLVPFHLSVPVAEFCGDVVPLFATEALLHKLIVVNTAVPLAVTTPVEVPLVSNLAEIVIDFDPLLV